MYQFVTNIGYGGFGVVDLVELPDGTRIARKTFNPQSVNSDPRLLENITKRFIREVKILSDINHINIMPILGHHLDINPPCYFMPYASTSLDKEMSKLKSNFSTNFNPSQILQIILDILAGLEEIHSLDIYHRDLKPQNILYLEGRYVISDFGLVSLKDTQVTILTQTGLKMGSDAYTAPEIVSELRNATRMSDIFSFGCILHDFFASAGNENRLPCQPIYDHNSIMGDVIEICTRTDPNRRFKNVKDLRESIVQILSSNLPQLSVSHETLDYKSYLTDMVVYDEDKLRKLVHYLENFGHLSDIQYIYINFTNDIINKITQFPERAIDFANLYSAWARRTAHGFERCDVIAGHLEKLYESIEDLGAKANILLSFLIMGAQHNRWYVEEKFMKHASSMNHRLCRRFIMEARVEGNIMRTSFAHLEYSIGADKTKLPLELQNYLNGSP